MAADEPLTPILLPRPRLLGLAVRATMLALVAALSLHAAPAQDVLGWLALMALASAPALVMPEHRVIGPLSRLAEVVTTCLAAAAIAHAAHRPAVGVGAAAIVLSYLWVPAVAATLARRRYEVPLLLAAAAVVLTAARVADSELGPAGYTGSSILWLGLAAVAASVAASLQHSLLSQRDSPQPYAEATRLLTQLRSVARQLPGANLDPGSLAEHLLDEVRAVAPASRAAVLSTSGGGRLVVLAQMGADRVDWETGLDTDSAIADAWASQQPQTASRSQARSAVPPGSEVSALVVPLVAGVRTVGLIALEADAPAAYPPSLVAQAAQVAAPAALRLEAALLFDEVRSLATSEERQRLAREIHDGVAQELVMVGYGIDNALATLPDPAATTEELRVLRSEVTRVITELRLSLFELRSEVDRYGGLATAIADYARTVGQSAGLRVHLSLDESTARLPAATEAELLRIAQEAITNARKHAGAENLWVTCTTDPPFAEIEVSDDGHGMVGQPKEGRYGLAIMAERAERIRGRLEIRPRVPSGTTVAVVLGSAPRRGSV
ncbi:MAG: ATPase [Dactylosporangium sp.]|jgi:signal transduction histidine kinase|nr:ATPase [Dactylosporangium sp.]